MVFAYMKSCAMEYIHEEFQCKNHCKSPSDIFSLNKHFLFGSHVSVIYITPISLITYSNIKSTNVFSYIC